MQKLASLPPGGADAFTVVLCNWEQEANNVFLSPAREMLLSRLETVEAGGKGSITMSSNKSILFRACF